MSSFESRSRGGGGSSRDENDILQQISNGIREIANNVIQIRQSTNRIGTNQDSDELRKNMNFLVAQTNQVLKKVTQDFKLLDSVDRGSDKQKKMLKAKLLKDFESTANSFKQITNIASQKEKSTPVPQQTFARRNDDHYAFDDEENVRQTENKRLLDQQFHSLEQERIFQDDYVRRRNEEIKEIEKQVIEVNEMFVDVSNLVQEQGHMIDNIESNVEKTSHDTKAATVELKKASEYQKSYRSKLCVLVLIILIIAGVAAIAIWWFASPSTPAPTPAPTPVPVTKQPMSQLKNTKYAEGAPIDTKKEERNVNLDKKKAYRHK